MCIYICVFKIRYIEHCNFIYKVYFVWLNFSEILTTCVNRNFKSKSLRDLHTEELFHEGNKINDQAKNFNIYNITSKW